MINVEIQMKKNRTNRSKTDLRSSAGTGGGGERFDGFAGGNRFSSRRIYEG
jgi:hypothetical protein